jgi:hypothetical protein
LPFNSANANSEFASSNAARVPHSPPSTWTGGTVGSLGVDGPFGPSGGPPHAIMNNASSAIIGFISTLRGVTET